MKRRVLVAYASRMGSTKEIAEAIGGELAAQGLEVDVVSCASEEPGRPVRQDGLPRPRTFGGRLDAEHATGLVSHWMAGDGSLSGDFRDWKLIRDWALEIAEELTTTRESRSTP